MHFGRRCQSSIHRGTRIWNSQQRPSLRDGLLSIGRTRSPSRVRICENQRASDLAWAESLRRFSSIPRRISASTSTLVPISSTGVRATQAATLGWARSRLRISEMMFVSSRNFTDQSRAPAEGVVDRTRRQKPRRGAPSQIRQRHSSPRDPSKRPTQPHEAPGLSPPCRAVFQPMLESGSRPSSVPEPRPRTRPRAAARRR